MTQNENHHLASITAGADSGEAVMENKPGAWNYDEKRDTGVN